MAVTAKVRVQSKTVSNEQASIGFNADYQDDRNKEWAKYTPALSLNMTVKEEIADQFEVGQAFTLTFTPES